MSKNPLIYHGEWWVPAPQDPGMCSTFLEDPRKMMGLEKKYTGTLTYYEDEDSTLELYHVPSNYHAKHYCQNNVMWGRDANGNIFTLFNVIMKEQLGVDFTNTKFVVGMILVGEHILSLDYNKFCCCIVRYPHLVNWTFYETQDAINTYFHHQGKYFNLTITSQTINIIEVSVDKTSKWVLNQFQSIGSDIRGYQITPSPCFEIRATEPISFGHYIGQIKEFTQFLSIALFGIQDPDSVEFIIEGDINRRKLLFKKNVSYDPGFLSVIKLKELKEKCKILLTCCILDMLGLTNKEINLCLEQSPISQIIDSLPLEYD